MRAADRACRRTVLAAILAAPAALGSPALASHALAAETQSGAVRLSVTLNPDRLGAHSRLTLAVDYEGGNGLPLPMRGSVIRMPAGMSLDVPSLRDCSPSRLLEDGASACPPQSRLGGGHALLVTELGSERVTEQAGLSIAVGPPENLHPTFEILASGYSPVAERRVLTGTVLPAGAPYGEALALSIPPIPTLAGAPDASVLSLTLAIGSPAAAGHRPLNSLLLPSSCPRGGFPFAARFLYAGGSSQTSKARVPCPR